jgi:hypothetical protein
MATCWIYIGILLGAHPVFHISRIRVKHSWVGIVAKSTVHRPRTDWRSGGGIAGYGGVGYWTAIVGSDSPFCCYTKTENIKHCE